MSGWGSRCVSRSFAQTAPIELSSQESERTLELGAPLEIPIKVEEPPEDGLPAAQSSPAMSPTEAGDWPPEVTDLGKFMLDQDTGSQQPMTSGSLAEELNKLLNEQAQEEYLALKVPKDQRTSAAHQMFCRLFLTELAHPVPSRHKPTFVRIYHERHSKVGADPKQLALEMQGGVVAYKHETDGLYSMVKPRTGVRVEKVRFHDGTEAPTHPLKSTKTHA